VEDADIYTTHNETIIPSAGFEPAIPAIERLQTYAFSRD
jgi:hypothetical protein